MITPLEIETKEFSRSVRGYDRDEVDEFLDVIILDLQDLLKELDGLRAENDELRAENDEHKKSQKKVMDTLESAKKLMKEMSESAEKRAETIIENAKMDAELILKEANSNVPERAGSSDELHDRINLFRSRYRQLLQDELESLDVKSGDLLTDLEKEFLPTLVDTQIIELEELQEGMAKEAKAAEVKPKDTQVLDAKAIDDLLAKAEEELNKDE